MKSQRGASAVSTSCSLGGDQRAEIALVREISKARMSLIGGVVQSLGNDECPPRLGTDRRPAALAESPAPGVHLVRGIGENHLAGRNRF